MECTVIKEPAAPLTSQDSGQFQTTLLFSNQTPSCSLESYTISALTEACISRLVNVSDVRS